MKVYIVAAKRTAIGSMLGSLKDIPAPEMGTTVVKALFEYTGVNPADIDEVIVGSVLPAGCGQGIGRQVSLKAGIPVEVPAHTVNMVCGSGMKAVMNAYREILTGAGHLIIAGGTENMSRAPLLIPCSVRTGHKMGEMKVADHMLIDGLVDAYSGEHMGITAENIAEKYNITRKEQDEFSYNSQQKAICAVDGGKFKEEIVPVVIKQKKGDIVFDTDEYPNRTTNLEKLSTLRPAFKANGTVTAGSSSGINDGASFVMVASEEAVKKYNLKPLVEIVAVGQGGVDPQYMGLGPTPAIRKALKNANLTLDKMDIIELNEAFASQSLGVIHELSQEHNIDKKVLMEKINPQGGAIALGHPVGASGNRILVTLIHELLHSKGKLGLASLCIGGGMGTAIIVRKA